MVEKIKKLGAGNIVRMMVLLLVSLRMFCHLFYATEKEFQIFKDMEIYKAMILFCIFIAIYRRINLKDYIAWIYIVCGGIFLPIYYKVRDISALTYGPDYFELLIYRDIIIILFIGLLLDLFRHKPYRIMTYLKNPVIVLYFFFVIVFAVTDFDSAIPYICPTLALVLTRLDDRDKMEMTYLFSISSYFAFAKCFTSSLINDPNVYEGGRYYGSFLNIGSAGTSCAVALIACVYMFFVFKSKKSGLGMVISLLLAIYPAIAIAMMGSRTVELGVFLVIVGLWVFLHGKGMKTTYIRFFISLFVILLIPVTLFGLSKILAYLSETGRVDYSDLNYFWQHVLAMTTTELMEDCIFEPGSFLFSLDALASTRISIYAEKITKIRFTGFNEYSKIGYNSHNFFLANLVKYGLLGGVPFLGWFFSCIFSFAKRIGEKKYYLFSLFLFLLMLGSYSTQSLYIKCMGGILLIITQVFILEDNEQR